MAEEKRLIVIDANSLIHRAFHALPPLTTKKGEIINAVYGFSLVLLKALKELKPDYVAACFDVAGPTFRHEKFEEYKAKRPKAPDELYSQIPRIKEILAAFDIPIFEKQGFEADDIIGTIVFLASQEKKDFAIETIILSGDRDAFQLIDLKTKVYFLRKGVKDTVLYDENQVREKCEGIAPDQLVDFKALRGDPSDNIPGARGIGEKTAAELIKKFGTVENIYKELEKKSPEAEVLKPKIKEMLISQKEQVFLSRVLSEIRKDAPIDFRLQGCDFKNFNKEKAINGLNSFGFNSLVKRLQDNGLD